MAELAKPPTYTLGLQFGPRLLFTQPSNFPSANTLLTWNMVKQSRALVGRGLASGSFLASGSRVVASGSFLWSPQHQQDPPGTDLSTFTVRPAGSWPVTQRIYCNVLKSWSSFSVAVSPFSRRGGWTHVWEPGWTSSVTPSARLTSCRWLLKWLATIFKAIFSKKKKTTKAWLGERGAFHRPFLEVD